jgi:O-antigen/teichoic acid export membrane protein
VALHTFVWLYFFNLLPSFSRNAAVSRHAVRQIIDPSLQVTAWSAVFIGVLGMVAAVPVVGLLYGPGYTPAIGALQVLIWTIPVTLLSGHYRYALIACGRQGLEFGAAAIGAVVNIGLNLVLIPHLGIAGAAWSLVASEIVIWTAAYVAVHRLVTPISVWPPLRLPALAGVLMLATLRVLPSADVWLTGGAVMVVFAVVLSITQPTIFANARTLIANSRARSADAISS